MADMTTPPKPAERDRELLAEECDRIYFHDEARAVRNGVVVRVPDHAALAAISRARQSPSEADMRAFGASEYACIKYPEDTPEHRLARQAYCEGAAGPALSPPPSEEVAEVIKELEEQAKRVADHYAFLGEPDPKLEQRAARLLIALRSTPTRDGK